LPAIFPIDQSVFDKVLNRKRSNFTNNGSKIVYAKIDENVFDVVLARKRKMAGKPNENFEPKEVSFDEQKDHTMMNKSEDLLEGSFFQGNKNILITNVDQHKTSGNDSDQQKTFDSGEVEPKNYDDDDDDDGGRLEAESLMPFFGYSPGATCISFFGCFGSSPGVLDEKRSSLDAPLGPGRRLWRARWASRLLLFSSRTPGEDPKHPKKEMHVAPGEYPKNGIRDSASSRPPSSSSSSS
jgi:hypothetical protein